MVINPVSKNLSENHPINFKSRIVPTEHVKNIIDNAALNVLQAENANYGSGVIIALNSILNDGKNDTVKIDAHEKTGFGYNTPLGTDVFVNGKLVMDNYVDNLLKDEYEIDKEIYSDIDEFAFNKECAEDALLRFTEDRTNEKIDGTILSKHELEKINPFIKNIQSIDPKSPTIVSGIKDNLHKINQTLFENSINELQCIKEKIFGK